MSKIRKGDRVCFNQTVAAFKIKRGDLATIMNLNHIGGSHFLNTDNPNQFNHPNFNGYGIILGPYFYDVIGHIGEWEEWEVEYLHSYYHRKSAKDIAKHLGKSVKAVYSKARAEGLYKFKARPFTKEDDNIIIHSLVDSLPVKVIAKKLHRTSSSVRGRVSLLEKNNKVPHYSGESKEKATDE